MWSKLRKSIGPIVILLTSIVAGAAALLANLDAIHNYFTETYVPAALTIKDVNPSRVTTDDTPDDEGELLLPFTIVVEKQSEGTAKNCYVYLFEKDLSAPFFGYAGKSHWDGAPEYIFSLEKNVRSLQVEIEFTVSAYKAKDNYSLVLSVVCDGIVSNKVTIPSVWAVGWDAAG